VFSLLIAPYVDAGSVIWDPFVTHRFMKPCSAMTIN